MHQFQPILNQTHHLRLNNKLIGITGKNIVLYDFNNNKMDNLLSIDSSIIYTKYIKDEIFYYADNKNLYIYDILKGILLKKKYVLYKNQ